MSFTGDLITKHEGIRTKVYLDTAGHPTIGVGFNLDGAGAQATCVALGLDYAGLRAGTAQLSTDQVNAIFAHQLAAVYIQAAALFPNYSTMPQNAQAVIADLIFNLGITTFQKFHQTIAALKVGAWTAAANCLTNSAWFHQVGSRAVEDVALLRSI